MIELGFLVNGCERGLPSRYSLVVENMGVFVYEVKIENHSELSLRVEDELLAIESILKIEAHGERWFIHVKYLDNEYVPVSITPKVMKLLHQYKITLNFDTSLI